MIFLFQHGGPSQFETFDPKMDAPREIRSVTGEIRTSVPGVTFGRTLEKLAKLADRLTVVRSFVPGDSAHDIKSIVGKHTLQANLGSLYSRVAGPLRPGTAMPTNVALFAKAVALDAQEPLSKFGDFTSGGEMGAAYRPFVPGVGSQAQADMNLALPIQRLDDRQGLLIALDDWKRDMDTNSVLGAMDHTQQMAFDLLRRGVSQAFDLKDEDPRLIARYDTAPLLPRDKISSAWKNIKHYGDNAASLGKLLLMARRLCERGVGFVTVTTGFVWDMHADVNNAPMAVGMDYVGRPFDHAVSALIEDIESRGLRDKIMLVCCGEMGRTPRLNAKGGRDHWGNLGPLMIYGGGTSGGRVIGESSKDGGEPADDAVGIPELVGTVLNTLIDANHARLIDGMPIPLLNLLNNGARINGLT